MKANSPCYKVRKKILHPPHIWKGVRADWKCKGYKEEDKK